MSTHTQVEATEHTTTEPIKPEVVTLNLADPSPAPAVSASGSSTTSSTSLWTNTPAPVPTRDMTIRCVLKPSSPAASSISSSPISLSASLPSPSEPIYFEHQRLSRCALHTLNNLLQFAAFDVNSLNAICKELTPNAWMNPHKSVLGLGNYDINVIMRALSRYGLVLKWFDRRSQLSTIPYETLFGLIINMPSRSFGSLGARHWCCLKRFASTGDWWWLDSDAPVTTKPHTKGVPIRPNEKAKKIMDICSFLSTEFALTDSTSGSSTSASTQSQLFLIQFDKS